MQGQLILVCSFDVPLRLIADCKISVYELMSRKGGKGKNHGN